QRQIRRRLGPPAPPRGAGQAGPGVVTRRARFAPGRGPTERGRWQSPGLKVPAIALRLSPLAPADVGLVRANGQERRPVLSAGSGPFPQILRLWSRKAKSISDVGGPHGFPECEPVVRL